MNFFKILFAIEYCWAMSGAFYVCSAEYKETILPEVLSFFFYYDPNLTLTQTLILTLKKLNGKMWR